MFGWQGWREIPRNSMSSEEVNRLSLKYMAPVMLDNILKESPIFQKLRSREPEKFDGGTMRVPFQYGKVK